MKTKETKIIIPTLFAIIIFVFLVIGSTYAYFTMNATTTGGSTNVNFKAENVGISKLQAGNNLKLNLSLTDMMKKNNNVTYYATLDGTPSTSENSEVIAIASVEGNGTMKCNYNLGVTASGTNNMYDAFINMKNKSENQLILNVDGQDYDLYDIEFPYSITGTLNNISDGNPKNITASFRLVNRYDLDQSDLNSKDLTLSFSVISYECSIVG